MKEINNNLILEDKSSNPAPLGLLGFGMTTVLLNLHNIGLFPLDSVIIAMGIFVGGMAQVFAGLLEWKKGNTFGNVAFTAYGLFWLSLVGIWLLPKFAGIAAPSDISMGFYLLLWGIFTLGMFFGTFKTNKILQAVFLSLALLFFLLSLSDFLTSTLIRTIGGFVGILCGSLAIYLALAEVLNEANKRTILPIFPGE